MPRAVWPEGLGRSENCLGARRAGEGATGGILFVEPSKRGEKRVVTSNIQTTGVRVQRALRNPLGGIEAFERVGKMRSDERHASPSPQTHLREMPIALAA